MMYFVIAAMKGEPGAPPGPGGLAAPGGGEAGAQGEGWARLPERTYCPGPGARAPPGPSGPTRRRHLSPAAGVCPSPAGGRGARGGPPSSAPSGFCQLSGSAGTWRGSLKKLCRPSPRFWKGGKVGGARRKPGAPAAGRPRPVPQGPHPGQLRPTQARLCGRRAVRARADAVSSPGTDWSAPQAWRPPAPAAQQPGAAARPGSAAGPRRVLPQPLPKGPGPE